METETIQTKLVKLLLLQYKPSPVKLSKYSDDEMSDCLSVLFDKDLIANHFHIEGIRCVQIPLQILILTTEKGKKLLHALEEDMSRFKKSYTEEEFDKLVKKYK
jgi:hypothetical protein